MKLQRLPQLNQKPRIFSADKGHEFAEAAKIEEQISMAFDDFSGQLLSHDNSDYDLNPHQGGVVVTDRYLDIGSDRGTKVSSASLVYDTETGDVESFKVITDTLNSVSYEHKRYDGMLSTSPTFTSLVNGQEQSFEMNPKTGVITHFSAE